ncbi:MAG TPA: hypothetical protein VMF13_19730 [Luteitalea sp.]|nr:hypothetical protein [Luteitalea sp.]
MVDVAEHPILIAARRYVESPQPAFRRTLIDALAEVKASATDLGNAASSVAGVAAADRPTVLGQIGRLLSMQVALWQSLVALPEVDGGAGEVRAALVDTMDEVTEVIEVVAFKVDTALSDSLQARIADVMARPRGNGPKDDWRATIAAL